MTIARPIALAQGLTRYFTGVACKRGHVAERMVSTRACVDCLSASTAAWREGHPERVNAQRRAWAAANPERNRTIKSAWNKANPEGQKARTRKWYEANKEKSFAASRRWRAENPGQAKAAVARWNEAHPEKRAASAARRRAAVLQRSPAWANHQQIEAFYARAKALTAKTGVEHHVDHIIPLQGKTVSGLHVETNLQVIPAALNLAKGNRLGLALN